MPGAGLFHLSLIMPILKTGESCRGGRQEETMAVLLLSGNETVTLWVKGICSGARDSSLGHRQACT